MINNERSIRYRNINAKKPTQLPLISKFISHDIITKFAAACTMMRLTRYKSLVLLLIVVQLNRCQKKGSKDIRMGISFFVKSLCEIQKCGAKQIL